MIQRFVEVTDLVAYGKFWVMRMTPDEAAVGSAMPDADGARLLTYGGSRRFNLRMTMVFDLQLGRGAGWSLSGGPTQFEHEQSERHPDLRCCPMYQPFLYWLYEDGRWGDGQGDIHDIPRYIELPPFGV